MNTAVNILLFLLGNAVSLTLIPIVEKLKLDYQASRYLEEIYIELSDLQEELTNHADLFFNFLLEIRAQSDEGFSPARPIPLPHDINTTLLIDIYKKSAIKLTPQQRQIIKRIPSNISSVMGAAQNAVEAAQKHDYCIQSIKNTIKLSCYLVHHINGIRNQRERFRANNDIDSNSVVIPVLKSIGFSDKEIELSKIEESNFN